MDWLNSLQNGRIKQIVTTAQTGAQLVSTINQIRQGFAAEQNEETVTQRTPNELTFTSPIANNDATTNQNLHGEFSREFLKEIVKKSPSFLEELNPKDGCTPLLSAVKRNNFNVAILLLSNGANVHAIDLSRNTALHHAIMARSPQMVKLLLLFRANPLAQNNAGKAAISLKTSSEVAQLLSHIRVHAENGVINSADKERVESAKLLQSKCEQIRQDQAIHYQRSKTEEEKSNSIRMLSLDGGGIRGLVLIQMLMELEELRAYGQDGKKKTTKSGKKTFVQRNFDWIAGTSTGAILALALADGTSLIDCLRLYLRLKDEIFCATIRPYPSECIEAFLKEQFGENRRMADLRSGKTRVFVTATKADQIPIKLVLFRNYRSPFNPNSEYESEKMQIWKAARCSSAAPTYFSSVDGIMDGGLIANNPGATLLLELGRQIDAIKSNLINADRVPDLAFLLSLGTGKTPEVPISVTDVDLGKGFSVQSIIQTANALSNLKSILVEQLATSDGQVVETSREIAHSRNAPYFRLTPTLQSDIQLDTVNNTQLIDMLWNTKIYMREKCSTELLALLTLMREFERDD